MCSIIGPSPPAPDRDRPDLLPPCPRGDVIRSGRKQRMWDGPCVASVSAHRHPSLSFSRHIEQEAMVLFRFESRRTVWMVHWEPCEGPTKESKFIRLAVEGNHPRKPFVWMPGH